MKLLALICTTCFLFISCKKDLLQVSQEKSSSSASLNFFSGASDQDTEIVSLAKALKRERKFVENLSEFQRVNGTPIWDHVKFKVGRAKASGNTFDNNANDTTTQGIFFVPLQLANSSQIKGYIAAYKHNDSSYTFKLYNRDSIRTDTYHNDTARRAMSAVLGVIAFFEKILMVTNLPHSPSLMMKPLNLKVLV